MVAGISVRQSKPRSDLRCHSGCPASGDIRRNRDKGHRGRFRYKAAMRDNRHPRANCIISDEVFGPAERQLAPVVSVAGKVLPTASMRLPQPMPKRKTLRPDSSRLGTQPRETVNSGRLCGLCRFCGLDGRCGARNEHGGVRLSKEFASEIHFAFPTPSGRLAGRTKVGAVCCNAGRVAFGASAIKLSQRSCCRH